MSSHFDQDDSRRDFDAQRSGVHDAQRSKLDARADRLARTSTVDLPSSSIEVLKFSIGTEQFAIETSFVKEVLHETEITPLPGNAVPLIGLANLRGEVLAIMSLLSVLRPNSLAIETGSDGEGFDDWIIVLGSNQARFGITVSAVLEVSAIETDLILNHAPIVAAEQIKLLRGVTKDAIAILDGQAVLAHPSFVIDQI